MNEYSSSELLRLCELWWEDGATLREIISWSMHEGEELGLHDDETIVLVSSWVTGKFGIKH